MMVLVVENEMQEVKIWCPYKAFFGPRPFLEPRCSLVSLLYRHFANDVANGASVRDCSIRNRDILALNPRPALRSR
jgi:hypothetical protein